MHVSLNRGGESDWNQIVQHGEDQILLLEKKCAKILPLVSL